MAGKKRSIRLRSIRDVERLLAKTINEVRRGEIDPEIATKIGYLANILLRALEGGQLERRIEQLQEQLLSEDV